MLESLVLMKNVKSEFFREKKYREEYKEGEYDEKRVQS